MQQVGQRHAGKVSLLSVRHDFEKSQISEQLAGVMNQVAGIGRSKVCTSESGMKRQDCHDMNDVVWETGRRAGRRSIAHLDV